MKKLLAYILLNAIITIWLLISFSVYQERILLDQEIERLMASCNKKYPVATITNTRNKVIFEMKGAEK